jgi:CBS domain
VRTAHNHRTGARKLYDVGTKRPTCFVYDDFMTDIAQIRATSKVPILIKFAMRRGDRERYCLRCTCECPLRAAPVENLKETIMKATDVMVRNVLTVKPDASVTEVARLLVENDISAVPVVDDQGQMVGIISEADLMRREEIGTEKRRPWWLEAMTPATTLANEFAKSRGKRIA